MSLLVVVDLLLTSSIPRQLVVLVLGSSNNSMLLY